MKKTLAIILMLACVLALTACGPAIKKPKEEVQASKFYEALSTALKLYDENAWKKNMEAEWTFTAEETSKTTYGDRKPLTETAKETVSASVQYNETLGLYYVEETGKRTGETYEGKYSSETKAETYSLQNGDKIREFNAIEKTYKDSVLPSNVHNVAMADLEEIFDELMGSAIDIDLLKLTPDANNPIDYTKRLEVDSDEQISYYIDGDVYTVVYKKNVNEEDEQETVEATVQITVKEDKITIVTEITGTGSEKDDTGVEEGAYDRKGSLTLEFKDVKVEKPDIADYTDVSLKISDLLSSAVAK